MFNFAPFGVTMIFHTLPPIVRILLEPSTATSNLEETEPKPLTLT